jgi:hypothetical protein
VGSSFTAINLSVSTKLIVKDFLYLFLISGLEISNRGLLLIILDQIHLCIWVILLRKEEEEEEEAPRTNLGTIYFVPTQKCGKI